MVALYPKDHNFYKLHHDDMTKMVKKGLKPEDQDHLFVVDRRYWMDLQENRDDVPGTKKIKLTGKHYISLLDNSHGEVVYDDSSAGIRDNKAREFPHPSTPWNPMALGPAGYTGIRRASIPSSTTTSASCWPPTRSRKRKRTISTSSIAISGNG